MANFDIKYDTVPQSPFGAPRGPSVTALRSALTTFNATSYSSVRLDQMSKGDMISAARIHALSVPGL